MIEVTPAPGITLERDPVAHLRPLSAASSACGLCGREQILALRERCRSLANDPVRITPEGVRRCCEALQRQQSAHAQTGGMHAAAVVSSSGEVWASAEDVGRHNAVDKAIGALFLKDALPARSCVLVVTSRASFEIVQKACVASIPVVVCVSAPTSLAVEMAGEFGMTLIGFARGGAFNVYTGAERLG